MGYKKEITQVFNIFDIFRPLLILKEILNISILFATAGGFLASKKSIDYIIAFYAVLHYLNLVEQC